MPYNGIDLPEHLHRALLIISGVVGLVLVLIWWSWPASIDPMASRLFRSPLFNHQLDLAHRPPWVFGVETVLVLSLAFGPVIFFRHLSAPAAWAATGGLLFSLLAVVTVVWYANGVMIQFGAATLSIILNGLIVSILLRSNQRYRANAPRTESQPAGAVPPQKKANPITKRANQAIEVRDQNANEQPIENKPENADEETSRNSRAEKIGRYEILRCIGKGAMGEVFLGRDPHINRLTAIKTLRFQDNFVEDEIDEIKDKFFREAESAGTLSHPNIVTIYDAGEDRGLAYIAMEYLEGITLLRFTRAKRLLPVRKVIAYTAKIAKALDYAHTRGIVHRDIKPANIMVLKNAEIKITDFGIARISASSHTQTGVVKGTPYYMSPEQFSGDKVDGRSDIFSLGTMLFQLLTGGLPFFSENPAVLMNQIMNFPHPNPRAINPRVMPAIIPIVNQALEKHQSRRYAQAGLMAADLIKLNRRIERHLQKKKHAGKSQSY